MILTSKGRYAINSVFQMAENIDSGPVRLSDIAKKQNISISYLEQIFSKLKKYNIVNSVKGPGGGYSLNLSRKITARDIIQAIGERVKMTSCANENNCVKLSNYNNKCKTHNIWKGLERNIVEYFESIIIFDEAS